MFRIKLSKHKLKQLRLYVYERDQGCLQCGSWDCPSMAHVKGRGRGGDDAPNNCIWLCMSSADKKGCHNKYDDSEIELKPAIHKMLEGEPLYL